MRMTGAKEGTVAQAGKDDDVTNTGEQRSAGGVNFGFQPPSGTGLFTNENKNGYVFSNNFWCDGTSGTRRTYPFYVYGVGITTTAGFVLGASEGTVGQVLTSGGAGAAATWAATASGSLWTRAGTILSTLTAGDSISLTGVGLIVPAAANSYAFDAANDTAGVGGYSYGVKGRTASSTTFNFGVYGWASGTSGTKYGVYGLAQGTGTANYGVYGSASGATANWAGYFNGKVGLNSSLSVNGSEGSDGQVLTSKGAGAACTWAAAGAGGITSLNALTGATQTFTNDTNVTITSAGTAHALGWSGTLSLARGGTAGTSGCGVWKRTSTILEPVTSGDTIATTGGGERMVLRFFIFLAELIYFRMGQTPRNL